MASKADATAALLKPQQKEQEVERKARKQFKGLIYKKQGEIADAGDREDHNNVGEKPDNIAKEDLNANNSEESREAAADACQLGLFSCFRPIGRRLFSGLGLQRCTILLSYVLIVTKLLHGRAPRRAPIHTVQN
ncbi:peptidyl-prolyl cis-trans isomerase PASTICCINO1-like [Carya illinoinensis]|uniref:Uncharacterized protein n=1 Tax=Carya illinoinensis TaxID=32201 RepID=A0A8T1PMH3_CARIL|nr:peptidyl-prolyl cis-trans isomerase PASTICCINO1-like [Carya illinoinensis]XP_042943659.1 peptidyl-prolyl cis-trans isomerase PASTICCINO1-like [Carya illinoinensis]KAG6643318.1 hypothetical protein CIPAW_09G202800 [Carya illinoinensis]KAG6697514.1 hypothetical protein I3842_09G204900 [Carya illinoinensis]